jgi:hypothetical protein
VNMQMLNILLVVGVGDNRISTVPSSKPRVKVAPLGRS